MTDEFYVRIWGARGSLASRSSGTNRYGGNTSCIEVMCGNERLIFDAGSGLQQLGKTIAGELVDAEEQGKKHPALNLFFTHCHYDHISGFPFFKPLYHPDCRINIWSGHLEGPDKTERMICEYMKAPYFPVGPEAFVARIEYHDFNAGDVLHPARDIAVHTMALNHHNGCIGYRINYDGRSICFITDTTHIAGEHDTRIIEFVKDADLMIYDATYTDAEFPQFWNYGHSTWEEGMRLTKLASVKRYCIFHHRPSRDDAALDAIDAECKKQFPQSWVAAEGLVIEV